MLAAMSARAADAPSFAEAGNLTYPDVFDQTVTLVDGRYESAPAGDGDSSRTQVWLLPAPTAVGDLDGDGTAERAVMLAWNGSGSGTFVYVAAVGVRDGKPTVLATYGVGDRPQTRALAIEDGKLLVDLITAGPGDGACCPTQKTHVALSLKDGAFADAGSREEGPLTLADLAGPVWRLVAFDEDPVPAGAEITLQVDGERLAGKSACNRYMAGITMKALDEVKIGAAAGTMMACPEPLMTLERWYLTALQGVNRLGFFQGKLALDFQGEDGAGRLLFQKEP
ncbi:MAG: META domain-containing protein [Geminicoccaceae bacterium]